MKPSWSCHSLNSYGFDKLFQDWLSWIPFRFYRSAFISAKLLFTWFFPIIHVFIMKTNLFANGSEFQPRTFTNWPFAKRIVDKTIVIRYLYETCRAATSKKTVIKTSLVTDRNYCRKRNVFNNKQEVSFFSTLTDSPVRSSREKVQNRVNEKNYFHPPSIDSASQLTKILSSFRIQQRLRSSFRLNYNEN